MKKNQSFLLRKLLSIPFFVELLAQQISLDSPNAKSQVILGRIIKVHRKFQSFTSLFVINNIHSFHYAIKRIFIVRKNGIDLGTNAKSLLYD
jgi:hypothetical protein